MKFSIQISSLLVVILFSSSPSAPLIAAANDRKPGDANGIIVMEKFSRIFRNLEKALNGGDTETLITQAGELEAASHAPPGCDRSAMWTSNKNLRGT